MRRVTAGLAAGVLLASVSTGCDTPRPPSPAIADAASQASSESPAQDPSASLEPRLSERGRGTYLARVSLTAAGCNLHVVHDPVHDDRIKFWARNRVGVISLDIGRIEGDHTFRELTTRLAEVGGVGGAAYFNRSLEGRVDIGFPHGGVGPLEGASGLSLGTSSNGTWAGPRGGATPGTYAIVCYRWSANGPRAVGIAGPIEVRQSPGGAEAREGRRPGTPTKGVPAGVIHLTTSQCVLDQGEGPIDARFVRFDFINDSRGRAAFDVGMIASGHTFRDLSMFVERANAKRRRGSPTAYRPTYFHSLDPAKESTWDGHTGSVGQGPRGPLKLDGNWSGTWSGPRFRPITSATLAIICLSRPASPHGLRSAAAVGPVEVEEHSPTN